MERERERGREREREREGKRERGRERDIYIYICMYIYIYIYNVNVYMLYMVYYFSNIIHRLAKSEEKAAVARVHRGEKEIAKYQRYAAALLAGSQSLQTALRKIDEVVLRLGSGDVRKELKELATPLDPKLFEDSGAYEHAEIDRKNRIDHLADTLEGIEPYVQTIFRRFDVVMREHAIEMGRDENEEKVRES
ncbi:hypothetical protein AAMO2058_001149500 [Amorphochlora amoebiformis]